MKLTINGNGREVADDTDITALLDILGLAGKPVVIELNETAISPSEFSTTALSDGDQLEVITIAAGG